MCSSAVADIVSGATGGAIRSDVLDAEAHGGGTRPVPTASVVPTTAAPTVRPMSFATTVAPPSEKPPVAARAAGSGAAASALIAFR